MDAYQKAFKELKELDKEIVLLSQISGVLIWDQERVPPKGLQGRSEQVALLQKKIHELVVSEKMGNLVQLLEGAELKEEEKALVRICKRYYDQNRKLDSSFVQHFSELTIKAQGVWIEARNSDNWDLFSPYLEEIVKMVREKASNLGYKDEPYDALLDLFEEGSTASEIDSLFSQSKKTILNLLDKLDLENQVDDTFLYLKYPIAKQEAFAKEILDAMGFDFRRGAQGISTHPYTISLGSDDIRITTRYTEPSVTSPLFSTIHEAGHALYEMGMSNELTANSSLANGASYAFHESQSRLWENMIGRSGAFWSKYFDRFKKIFPIQTQDVDFKHFLKAINKVSRSAIRVDADEVTYNLHIILRFEIERALLNNEVEISQLPELWKNKMGELLNVKVKSYKEGVLQDVHWAMGEFGYFPSYALGNFYSAQILNTMEKTLDVDSIVRSGDFTPIKEYLDSTIYRHGSIYKPKELLKKITSEELKATYFENYLTKKYLELGE